MKRFITLLGCGVLTMGFSLAAQAASGPETIDLKDLFKVEGKKNAVLLPHHKHQAKVGCQSCHHTTSGGGSVKFTIEKKSGISNDFHKKWCWPCHIEMQVPKGKSCSTCHNGPK